mmetsp:Transcript_8017/g.18597  ORF Transcript_8017/g.18597 Transcript_8017/m.18597 type:complete len:533 (+) Transcript_8017:382-1980(+)
MRYERTLETKRGYRYSHKQNKVPYAGSPDKLFTRISIKHPSGWGLGVTARKGAGEALVWEPTTQRYGLTSWRIYGQLNHKSKIKTLLVGDYAVGYGQGLVLNAGFSMNKSSETVKIIRTNNLGIRPHTSVTTAGFKGLAATWQWQPMELSTYYSNTYLDGKIQKGAFVHSVSRSGYYRTQGEISKKGKVNEQVMGGTLVYKGPTRDTELGINLLYGHYSLPIYPDLQRGNPHRFHGQHHANGSIFYRYLWQNLHFFGEGALSRNGGRAVLLGIVASLSRYVDATVLWRHYGKDFHSLYGKAFRENATANTNERGIYLGASVNPWRHLYLDVYYDYFHFPWCFGKPRSGYSWLAKATYQISKTSLVYFQYKTTHKPRQVVKRKKIAMGTRQHYKVRWKYALNKAMRFQSEIQCSHYQQLGTPTWGYAAVQDIIYKLRILQFKGRLAWFNAEHSDNKLYFYEPNVLHTGFNFHIHQGKGMRYCLLVCYRPITILRLELKYTLTHRMDHKKMGSGYETLRGNVKNDVALQAILKF